MLTAGQEKALNRIAAALERIADGLSLAPFGATPPITTRATFDPESVCIAPLSVAATDASALAEFRAETDCEGDE